MLVVVNVFTFSWFFDGRDWETMRGPEGRKYWNNAFFKSGSLSLNSWWVSDGNFSLSPNLGSLKGNWRKEAKSLKKFLLPLSCFCIIMQKNKRKQSILDQVSRIACGVNLLDLDAWVLEMIYFSAAVFVLIAITTSSPQDFKTVH